MADLDEIADELYGLPPEEFTAARTLYEKEAKAAADRELAARIHSLGKPTVTAWLANQLAREHRDELEPLLELGASLRDATRNLAGDQLRALSRQQHELVQALVHNARQLARTAGRSVSEDTVRGLEETLRAALADEEAASLLLAGHLTDALHNSGFETGFGSSNVIPLRPRQSASTNNEQSGGRRQPAEERRRQAEQGLVEAERAVADTTTALDDAQKEADGADHAAAAAQQRLADLRQQLEEASTSASDADRRRRDASKALQRAELAVRNAELRRSDAQDRRDRLAGDN